MQTYAQWKNAQGGINGHPLKVVVLDDGGAPDKATSNAKAMLDQKPVMILGHVASQAAIPQQKVWDDAGIATTAYVPTIQLLSSPYMYAVGMSAPDSVQDPGGVDPRPSEAERQRESEGRLLHDR